MTFTVTRRTGTVVHPSEPTPCATLNLSEVDRLPNLRINIQTLHVFKHGHKDVPKIIRDALSKALVPYYPLAGRLTESPSGELQIACSGDGVWFVEAITDRTLDSFNYFNNVSDIPHDHLLPTPPPESLGIDPLVQIQVTHFVCEGFVMGVTFCHSICDGMGAAQFLNTVGEFARGFSHPSIAPVWHREAIPARVGLAHAVETAIPPPLSCNKLEHASIDISLDQIKNLKNQFMEMTGHYCSTFDVVAASLWRERSRAIILEKEDPVKLVFFGNTRKFLNPPLPEGYYGNCFFPVTVTATSGWLIEASNAEIVKLIKEAKARLPNEFTKWVNNKELGDEDPFCSPLKYTSLYISEWGGLGFNMIDYGWGRPVHVVPIQGPSIMPIGIIGSPPMPKTGIRLMTWCVESPHLKALVRAF
ncbi:spermidine dicoumaroyl transferase [Ranunculus cassubicifolius]